LAWVFSSPPLVAVEAQPQAQPAPQTELARGLPAAQRHEEPQVHGGAQLQDLQWHWVVIGTSWVSGC
jgi:hypothetical protein